MTHLLRAQPDVIWRRGYVTLGTDLKQIDQNTFVAINGDWGGFWTPSADIAIGGEGVVVAGPWWMDGAAAIVDTNGTTALVTFDKGTSDDVFGLTIPASVVLVQALLESFPDVPEQILPKIKALNGAPTSPSFQGTQSLLPGSRFLVPLRTHEGGLLETVAVLWAIYDDHLAGDGSTPQNLPKMRVVAFDANGTKFPLRTLDASTDADGFQALSTAANRAAYTASVTSTWTYTCNQNNRIDLSKYSYWLEFIDESGANAWTVAGQGTQFISASSTYDDITLLNGRA